jgi:hypothetical protein
MTSLDAVYPPFCTSDSTYLSKSGGRTTFIATSLPLRLAVSKRMTSQAKTSACVQARSRSIVCRIVKALCRG